MELYRIYRPDALSDIAGQDVVVESLQKMITGNTLPHTILLAGESGCGKTTVARILGKTLQVHSLNMTEVNVGSERGVEAAADIVSSTAANSIIPGNRLWILDEVQTGTKTFHNSLLKIFEEAAETDYFILCTTDPDKLPKAVLTRCVRFDLKLLSINALIGVIDRVMARLNAEGKSVNLSDDVKQIIAFAAQGSPRQALVIFEKVYQLDDPDAQKDMAAGYSVGTASVKTLFECFTQQCPDNWQTLAKLYKDAAPEPEGFRRQLTAWLGSSILNNWGKYPVQKMVQVLEVFSSRVATEPAHIIVMLYKAFYILKNQQ